MCAKPLPRIRATCGEEFAKEYYQNCRPVVLEGAGRNWPALRTWTIDRLIEHAGQTVIALRGVEPQKSKILDLRQVNQQDFVDDSRTTVETTVREYLGKLQSSKLGDPYLAEVKLGKVFPTLLEDVGPLLHSTTEVSDLSLMLSSRSVAPFHYHVNLEAISYQVTGIRRFFLLPPWETKRLAPMPVLGPLPNFSSKTFSEEEIDTLDGTVFECILQPGDAVYIPPHWWHTVFSRSELSILLVDFFKDPGKMVPKDEVSERLDRIHDALRDFIAEQNRILNDVIEPHVQTLCLERLIGCYHQLGDKAGQRNAIERLLPLLPPQSQKVIDLKNYLKSGQLK